jgi:hypothetical protein
LASLLTENIYCHKNGLKHINTINSDGFSALFVVNTPISDNSGVAHGVEHMVFRRSNTFPQPETLFQLTSLTDAKINASTFANTTYFHCQSQCSHTFTLAINYLLNGIFNPIFDNTDLLNEIHDGNNKGVIYRELLGSEQLIRESSESNNQYKEQNKFCYGGLSTSIGELSINDLTIFHQRYYHASNITLITANANIEQIASLVALLPKQENQSKQIKITSDEHKKNRQEYESNRPNTKKYSQTIKQLISIYYSWLQDPYYQEIDDFTEIESTKKTLVTHKGTLTTFSQSDLIFPLITLSDKLIEEVINEPEINHDIKNRVVKKTSSIPLLPNLFTTLCQQAKSQLISNELNHYKNHAYVSDQGNALWLTEVSPTEQILASITSYIISAYPKFLVPRCQGSCYATQALTIEKSAYLAIYSAFSVNPEKHLEEISHCLLSLSLDICFISSCLALAKIKYCQVYQVNNNQVMKLTSTDISKYLKTTVNYTYPKV